MIKRYSIDERVGCAAIIDTFHPVKSPGLHSDNANVVKFIMLPRCDAGAPKLEFDTRFDVMVSLQNECDNLNLNPDNIYTKGQIDELISNYQKAVTNLITVFPNLSINPNIFINTY